MNKPDFKSIAEKFYYDNSNLDTDVIVSEAMELVWSSHVEPLQKENERLKNELLLRDVTMLPEKDRQLDELQSEITRLKEENESLKDRIKCLMSEGEQPPF